MNQLSTEREYAVILFHDKSEKYINEREYQSLLKATENPQIKSVSINGNLLSLGGINKVLTLEEYYTEYPERKPNAGYGQPTSNYNFEDFRSEQLSKNGLASMIKGIKKAIAEFRAKGKEPTKALELLSKAEKSYKQRYI